MKSAQYLEVHYYFEWFVEESKEQVGTLERQNIWKIKPIIIIDHHFIVIVFAKLRWA